MYIKTMMNIERISIEALSLSYQEKGILVDRLIESMGSEIDPEIQKTHIHVAEQRLEHLRSGKANAVPGEEALRSVRNFLK